MSDSTEVSLSTSWYSGVVRIRPNNYKGYTFIHVCALFMFHCSYCALFQTHWYKTTNHPSTAFKYHTCTMIYQPIFTIPDCLTRCKGTWDLLLTEIKLKFRVTLYSTCPGTYQQPVPWHPSRWGLFLGFVPA